MNRKAAVEGAMASMRMEGFVFTDEEELMFKKLAKGEISSDDVIKIADELIKRWQIENPECFTKER